MSKRINRVVKKTHDRNHQQLSQPLTSMPHYFDFKAQDNGVQNNLPRPILPSVDSIYTHNKSTFSSNNFAFPPAQSLFISQNNCDAGTDFLRPTSAKIFGNIKKSSFPEGVWICPFGSDQVYKINVNKPLRCTRCKAYVNSYFRFCGSKDSAICNICGITFTIDRQKIDINNINNPQLATSGVVDFVVNQKSLINKQLKIIKIIIALQLNTFLIQSNILSAIINSIKASIENTQFQKSIRFGIVLLNGEGITYLKLHNSQTGNKKQPTKYLIRYNDKNLCCPLSDNQMLLDPIKEKIKLLDLFDWVNNAAEDQYKNGKYCYSGANYALAIKSIMQGFERETGRIMLFTSSAPRTGLFALKQRNESENKSPLTPLTLAYYQLSRQLVKARIGVDMYFITKQVLTSLQLVTTHFLTSSTGGTIHLYSPFISQNHSQNLYYNIYGSLNRKYVYDVNFTTRFSNGLNVAGYGIGDGIHQTKNSTALGIFNGDDIRQTKDVSLSMFDPATSVTVGFQHCEKIQENNSAFIQFAIIFTTGDGQRIIRVLNYKFQITNKICAIHQACDYLAVANILLREVTNKLLRGDSHKVREDLINKLIAIGTEYTEGLQSEQPNFEMKIHPNFSPVYAYLHSFINSRVVLNYYKTPTDYRICQILKVNTYNFLNFANLLYPKLFSLGTQIYESTPTPGNLIEGQGDIEQSVVLPPNLPLTCTFIQKQGVYLNWFPQYLLILVQPSASSSLLTQIFNTVNWDVIESYSSLPQLQTAHNIRINLMIDQLRRRSSRINGIYLPLVIRTSKAKGPFNDLWNVVLKEDYRQCKLYSFMELINRQVLLRLK